MRPFVDSSDFDLSPYFARCPVLDFAADVLVFDVAKAERSIMLVESGLVRVTVLNRDGAERMLYYKIQGGLLGDTSCFSGVDPVQPRGVRVVAVTPVRVRVMARLEFERLCRSNLDVTFALLKRAHRQIEHLAEQLAVATFQRTTAQVAGLIHALWLETQRADNGHGDLLRLTHQEIATATGRSRVSVTYAMNKLREHGAIGLHRGRIEVHDADALALASGG